MYVQGLSGRYSLAKATEQRAARAAEKKSEPQQRDVELLAQQAARKESFKQITGFAAGATLAVALWLLIRK